MDNIVFECAGILNVNVEDLRSESREKGVSYKRKLVWYKLKLKGYAEKEIAEYFNRKSKSTVYDGIKSIEGYLFWKDKETIDLLLQIGVNFTLRDKKIIGVV